MTVTVAYHVGSKNEKAGRTGFAHFFEHMMFRGTKNVPNYDIPLKDAGASSNAFTNEDMTAYFEAVPSNFLERALYLEAERLAFLPSALDQHKFDTEREVVKNERRQSVENRPYGLDEEAILASLFPMGHPYSWSVIGSMDDLNKATLDDLKAFFAEFYHPANATLCLAGDFDPAEAKALIQKYFSGLAAGPKPRAVPVPATSAKAEKLLRFDRVQLPRVYWNWPAVAADHADAPALDLLARVLAGGETSRLHRSLVLEKRLSKDVSADSPAWEAAGMFSLESTASRKGAADQILAAIEAAFDEAVRDIKANPPSEDELARAVSLVREAIVCATDPPALARHHAGHRLRAARRPAALSKGVRALLSGHSGRPDACRSHVPHARQGHCLDRSGHCRPPAERGGKSRSGPDSRRRGACDRRRPPARTGRRLVQDARTGPAPAVPGPAVRPGRCRAASMSGSPSGKRCPWCRSSCCSRRGRPTTRPASPAWRGLIGSLLDKGTSRRTATELAEALETLGVTLDIAVVDRRHHDRLEHDRADLEPSLKLVAEVLASPRFDPRTSNVSRHSHWRAWYKGRHVTWLAARALPALVYGQGHPYANPADGFAETIKTLTLNDIKSFHAGRIGPKGATLIVVGDVETDVLFPMLESTLGRWTTRISGPAQRPAAHLKADPGVIYFVDKPGAVQSVLNVGRLWTDRSDPTYYATLLGNRILGGDFLSRLNQDLREKNGYTYGARSGFRFRRSGSLWNVSTAVRTDATAPASRKSSRELDGLAGAKPISDQEIGPGPRG